ncbi:regucalcin-like [Episyrphus balteatus]|uniref:regucalcin-like n=1 Tax=Episyrphus balteatus TaxID=286459 RepID=UPI0024862015|nr:regucalcin-like [Episyrphus balteatus]
MVVKLIALFGLISSFLVGVLADNEIVEDYKVKELPSSYAHLGEGPHWDIATQNLYMVDLDVGKLKRLDYNQKKWYKCQIENATFATFIIPVEGTTDKFAVGIERQVAIVKWDGVSETCKVEKIILTVEQSYNNNRFNDAKCDPLGRLFAGTMRKSDFDLRTGHLFKLLKPNSYEVMLSNLGIANGLVWNEKGDKFYFVDSQDYNVKQYDYNTKTGEISNAIVISNTTSLPDGMTIDNKGFLYVAGNGGSAVLKIDPKKRKIVQKIEIPAKEITSCAFGGPNLDILFVTTANEKYPSSNAGKTYMVTGLGARGLPMTKLNLKHYN